MRIPRALGLLLPLLLFRTAPAQEISLAAGPLRAVGLEGATYGWQVAYAQRISRRTALSFSWINEGHPQGHHRDGPALSLVRTWPWGKDGLLAASAGLMRTFDTEFSPTGYRNTHGFKGVFSVLAQQPLGQGLWKAHLQALHTAGGSGFDTRSLLLGLGLSLGRVDRQGPPPGSRGIPVGRLSLLGGKAILNSMSSEQHAAFALEYRLPLDRALDLELGFVYADEGDLERVDRDGLGVQLWIVRQHFGDRLRLGLGFGPALLRSTEPGVEGTRLRLAGRAALLVGWDFPHAPWALQGQWIRTGTGTHQDSDLILTGITYRF